MTNYDYCVDDLLPPEQLEWHNCTFSQPVTFDPSHRPGVPGQRDTQSGAWSAADRNRNRELMNGIT